MGLTSFIEPVGCKVECHCAGAAFVTDLSGLDMYVVFKADSSGTLALLTSCVDGKRGAELEKNFNTATLFNRLFPPAPGPGPYPGPADAKKKNVSKKKEAADTLLPSSRSSWRAYVAVGVAVLALTAFSWVKKKA